MDSMDSVLSEPPCNVQRGIDDFNYNYNVPSFESRVDAVVLCERVMRPAAHGDLFCAALQFGEWYKILLRAREKEDSNND